MKVTVIGSHLCPDTLAALNQLSGVGADITFRDILSCHADLRAYLELRDTSEVYACLLYTSEVPVAGEHPGIT